MMIRTVTLTMQGEITVRRSVIRSGFCKGLGGLTTGVKRNGGHAYGQAPRGCQAPDAAPVTPCVPPAAKVQVFVGCVQA